MGGAGTVVLRVPVARRRPRSSVEVDRIAAFLDRRTDDRIGCSPNPRSEVPDLGDGMRVS